MDRWLNIKFRISNFVTEVLGALAVIFRCVRVNALHAYIPFSRLTISPPPRITIVKYFPPCLQCSFILQTGRLSQASRLPYGAVARVLESLPFSARVNSRFAFCSHTVHLRSSSC